MLWVCPPLFMVMRVVPVYESPLKVMVPLPVISSAPLHAMSHDAVLPFSW